MSYNPNWNIKNVGESEKNYSYTGLTRKDT